MKIKANNKAKNIIILLIAVFTLCIVLLFKYSEASYKSNMILFLIVFLLFSIVSIYSMINGIRRNLMFLILMLVIFVFQFSYVLCEILLGGEYNKDANAFGNFTFNEAQMRNTFCALGVAVIFFVISYFITSCFIWSKVTTSATAKKLIHRESIRVVAKYIYFMGYPFILYKGVVSGAIILEKGYLYYFTHEISMGFLISQISALTVVALAIYLATRPPLKECILVLILSGLHYGLFVLQGDRLMIVTYIAIILMVMVKGGYLDELNKIFLMHHNFKNPEKMIRRRNRRKFLALSVVGTLLVICLIQVNYIRDGRGIIFTNIYRELSRQGQSVFLVSHADALELSNKIDKPVAMLIEPLTRQLTNNTISRQLGIEAHITTQTIEAINENPQSCDIISYAINPERWFEGRGLGSSFILEGYLLGGLIGVSIISMVLGSFIALIDSGWKKNIIFDAFILYSFSSIIKQPREMLFSIAYYIVPFMIRALLIILGSLLIKQKFYRKKTELEMKIYE